MESNQQPKNRNAQFGKAYLGHRNFGANKSKSARQTLQAITKTAIRKAKKANGGRLTSEQMVAVRDGIRDAMHTEWMASTEAQDLDDFTRPATPEEAALIQPEKMQAGFQDLVKVMDLQ